MVEGQIGYVVLSYAAFGAAVGLLVAWVGLGHVVRKRRLTRLESAAGSDHDA